MLKVPKETWDRLREYIDGLEGWPRPSSLHGGISCLLDLEKSAREQGGTTEFFRDRSSGYGYRDEPVKAKFLFPVGIVDPEIKGKDEPDQDLTDLMTDTNQVQDETDNDS